MKESEKEKTLKRIKRAYAYYENPFHNVLKYYDFKFWKKRLSGIPEYEWAIIKMPCYNVKQAIMHFIYLHHSFNMTDILEKQMPLIEGHVAQTLIYQVQEYKLKKCTGFTVAQHSKTKLYNRHDFLPFFEMKYKVS